MANPIKFNFQPVITFLTIALVILNASYCIIYVLRVTQSKLPVYEPGYQFADFKDKVKGEKIIGYLTDRDSTPEKNDQEFLLAQYMLAPTILDLNNPDHKLLVLDFMKPMSLALTMRKHNLTHIYDNKFNKVLAVHRP